MKRKNVIPHDALPPRSPIVLGAVLWLVLDRVGSPAWLWGVVGTLYALLIVVWIESLRKTTEKPLPGYGDEE